MAYGAIAGYGEGEVPPSHIDQSPLIVCAVMLGCAWITIILRLYTRTYLVYAFGWDDVLMILSLASFTVYAGGEMNTSLKRNLLDHLPWATLKSAIEGYVLHLIFYVVTIIFLKLSVGVFLMRIANKKVHKRIIYATMAISTVWGLVSALVAVFQCGYPRSMDFYIIQRVNGRCISGAAAVGFGYSWAAVTAISDIVFTALPLFILRDAQINKRAKIVLSGILTLGALGSIAALIRFAYVEELRTVDNRFFLQSMKLGIWSSLECGLGISAGSLATLRPMFRKLLQGARTIGIRTKESLSAGGSGRRDTIRMTESRSRSFAHRFSLTSKRATMSTSKRLSDIEDLEAYPSPAVPFPESSTADKSYEMGNQTVVSVNSGPQAMRSPQSPRGDRASHDWLREGQISKETAFETRNEPYDFGRNHTARSSQSDRTREETWI